MTRKIANLCSALLAVLVASALVASVAQAGEFTSASEATVIEGEGTSAQVFTGTEPLEFSCETATFEGEVEGESSFESLTIHPEYRNCEILGGLPMTVKFTSCDYLFTANAVPLSTVHVECENSGDTIDIVAYLDPEHLEPICEIKFEEGSYTGVGYTNNGGNMVSVNAEVTGMSYAEIGALCPQPGVTQNNGTYRSTATMFGFDATTGLPTNISVDVP